MTACTKQQFRSRDLAYGHGKATCRATLDVQRISAYRCATCRYPDGQRAWHWGHHRPRGPRP